MGYTGEKDTDQAGIDSSVVRNTEGLETLNKTRTASAGLRKEAIRSKWKPLSTPKR